MTKRVTIMDIAFDNTTKQDLLENNLYPHLVKKEKLFVVTANPEIVMYAQEDRTYQQIVQSADYVIPDGIGIIKAAQWKKTPLKERIPGFELMVDLLAYANKEKLRCYFLGAKESTSQNMVDQVKKTYPSIDIAGNHHGYFELEDEELVKDISESAPDIIFVALGFPRQEQWIYQHMDKFSKGLFMGVGGSFDGFTGEVKRAPQQWIDWNLEWLYRFIKQPVRFKRILKLVEFMGKVVIGRG